LERVGGATGLAVPRPFPPVGNWATILQIIYNETKNTLSAGTGKWWF
jgi:hypothetical protein